MKLAQLPVTTAFALRIVMFAVAFVLWVGWTMRYAIEAKNAGARRRRVARRQGRAARVSAKDMAILVLVVSPMAAYVYGSMALGWGFNELSAGFFIGAVDRGIVGRPRRRRHDDGVSRGHAESGARGAADRRRAQHLARAERTAT